MRKTKKNPKSKKSSQPLLWTWQLFSNLSRHYPSNSHSPKEATPTHTPLEEVLEEPPSQEEEAPLWCPEAGSACNTNGLQWEEWT